jgi:short subunit dehydrogenase-like uncharacterized protein
MGNSSSASVSSGKSSDGATDAAALAEPSPQVTTDTSTQRDEARIATDVTVFGATGFVARYVCNYLVASAAAAGACHSDAFGSTASTSRSSFLNKKKGSARLDEDDTDYDAIKAETTPDRSAPATTAATVTKPLRLTLAGRNESKLKAVLENLKSLDDYSASAVEIDIFVADADDIDALTIMASRTRVVLNTAGPFSKFGTNVVSACATTGADYVDITGETHWAGEMRAKFGPVAAKSGARIISFCGFDSIPSDLAVYAAVRSLRDVKAKKDKEDAPTPQIVQAKCWHSCFGGANGGTVETAVNTIPVNLQHMIFDESSGELRPIPFLMNDPFELILPSKKKDPNLNAWRHSAALAEWKNQSLTLDSELSDFGCTVSAPFFMAVCNAKIVHASAVALKYYTPSEANGNHNRKTEESFTYWERFLPAGLNLTCYLNIFSIIPALSYSFALAAITVTLKMPIVGQKLLDYVLPPGAGTPDWINEMGYSDVYCEVLSVPKGNDKSKGVVDRGTCRLIFEGDPGNLCTAQCVSEAALTLVHGRDDLPPTSEDGFGTPAQLLGDALLSRLLSSRVRNVSMETKVIENDRRFKWERISVAVAMVGAVGLAITRFWL